MIPQIIPNWVSHQEKRSNTGEVFEKYRPDNGSVLCRVVRSRSDEVAAAVAAALEAQTGWAATPGVKRGEILNEIVARMKAQQDEIARVVALETGKSFKDARGETAGAAALGLFYASEGQRLYGRTTTSAVRFKYAATVRQPIGIAGLIVAANTPIANVAWKVFPALICGNTAVLKAAEDAPATAWIFGQLARETSLPAGVLNIVQGLGEEAGAALVAHPAVGVISFTGSTQVGRIIHQEAGKRLARISLELGGKNPLVVCDDADLQNAAKWVLLSAFSNAGQRCASASRIIIFDSIYDEFRRLLVEQTQKLKVGTSDDDDFGPVINEEQLNNLLSVAGAAERTGARILAGGYRLEDAGHAGGYFLAPTLIEEMNPQSEISQRELFGPVALLYRVRDFNEALALANDSPYGLTACIHTRNYHRALRFCDQVQAGVAVVNGGTFGSEPHMPFGGVKQSGNGSREPGTEALNVYSELKDIYLNFDPAEL